ncbi:MAG: TrbG/VirB9 family P-type conjugative transfer protein, partial [Pseudomonadota bacterium]|nr:TrbG/VirB9 family P-type conjugative transfer protein [Pseudomonadota bacterium]
MATRGRWLGLACLGSVLLMGSTGARSMDRVNQAKLVVFHYDANRAYTLYTRPGAVTDLELPAGETVQAMALGDSVQWVVEQSPGHVFIKPVRQGLFTSATLVTSRRTYQLILRSLKPEGVWFQRV